ncbi:MAG TPA: dihydrofolate reductase [Bacteroidales bacterium]|nr:dihydrofolate reductase [Bacteroidales bacterium]
MMPITLIAALADRNAIGLDNNLLYHIPEDLKRFKQITSGHTIIMGRKTWDSLKVKPLPDRKNIVITNGVYGFPKSVVLANSIEDALKACDPANENFVIGGETIYRLFLPFAQKLYITRIYASFDADTFFPEIDKSWEIVSEEPGVSQKELPFKFSYQTYKKSY